MATACEQRVLSLLVPEIVIKELFLDSEKFNTELLTCQSALSTT
jgi:hypothetical protein